MPRIGNVSEFNPKLESIDSYLDRLDGQMEANAIGVLGVDPNAAARNAADRQKVSFLISTIGLVAYGTLENLCNPRKPKEKTFAELTKLLIDHYKPPVVEIAESFKFHRYMQKENQTISDYSSALRGLASTCNFGGHLERALRDQFVCGLHNETTQTKLLEEDRTFAQCLKVALADEAARGGAKHMHKISTASVNFMKKKGNQKYNKDTKSSNSIQSSDKKNKDYRCYSCGKTGHYRSSCKYRNYKCEICHRAGHIKEACKSHSRKPKGVNLMDESDEDSDKDDQGEENLLYTMHSVNSMSNKEIQVPVKIQGQNVDMMLDTGCALSLAPRSFYEQFCDKSPLRSTQVVLSTYTGEKVLPLGECTVSVGYNAEEYQLPLLIVPDGSTPLFGRNWLKLVKLDWKNLGLLQIRPLQSNNDFSTKYQIPKPNAKSVLELLDSFPKLFDDELGCYKGPPVELKVHTKPKYFKARIPAISRQMAVEATLKKMEQDDIIARVYHAECAAPLVTVDKHGNPNDLRVCGDFSLTFNVCADMVTYPIPRIEDLHSALRGCTKFSILDMSQAYHQIPIAKQSQKWLTVNTHIGLFAYKRLPNGIHSGPGVFQEIMDKTLSGIPKVICYLDDILVAGTDDEDHLATLNQVLQRLESSGFKLKRSKCKFGQSSVTYLAHRIDAEGLHPTTEKLEAIKNAPAPTDVTQLKSFLGLIMFYSRFLEDHSTVLSPLNYLLKKDVSWRWTRKQQAAFEKAKELLLKSQTLVHYDDRLPLFLSCDASSYGAGAVLSHRIDGQDRPVAFASVTLTPAQRNYSQLDKEAFSIIFGLKRFHQFLSGREFTIITDHQPLLRLLGHDQPAPVHAAARLQRWAIILAAYNYKIIYRSTQKHADADSMSRIPLKETWEPHSENVNCFFFEESVNTDITSQMIATQTRRDPLLSKVYNYTATGSWPDVVDPDLAPYKSRRFELTIEQSCVLWGSRVIVPTSLQSQVLWELHETHMGICKTKALARSYIWWPRMDSAIEEMISSCLVCQALRPDPPKAIVHPWLYPTKPWSRIHVDFAGPVEGETYLIVVDAYSKFPEICKMRSTTSAATIKVMRELFSRYGIPEYVVSDNGPQFRSEEFQQFCQKNNVIHRTSSVHKPSTNGQAEIVVKLLKTAIKQAKESKTNVDKVIANYLLIHRNTPHTTTGEIPAVLFFGRRLRTKLDRMLPSVRSQVERNQQTVTDRTAQRGCRTLMEGDNVQIRNYGMGGKWRSGKIIEVIGSKHYMVDVDGELVKRHIDQIVKSSAKINSENSQTIQSNIQEIPTRPTSIPLPSYINMPSIQSAPNPPPESTAASEETSGQPSPEPTPTVPQAAVPPVEPRYPVRANRNTVPSKLKDFQIGK